MRKSCSPCGWTHEKPASNLLMPAPAARPGTASNHSRVSRRHRPAVLGQSFAVFAAVELERHVRSDVQAFQKAVTQLPGILEVHHIAGAFEYLLRVAVADLAS